MKILQSHLSSKDDGFLRDTDRWKKWFYGGDEFNGENGIALNFCTDVNHLKTAGLVYSMWPLMISVLNFPIAFRKSVGGILLLGIIPGNGRHEANNLSYNNELLILSDCNMYYMLYMKAPLEIKVILLQYVLDFPGISKLMKLPGTGAIRVCPWCCVNGKWCKPLHKTVYPNMEDHLANDVNEEKSLRTKYDDISVATKRKTFALKNGVKGTHEESQES